MSKVITPKDWDPQDLLTPLDVDVEWAGIEKPANYQYPKEYLAAKQNGEMAAVAADICRHALRSIVGNRCWDGIVLNDARTREAEAQ